MTSFLILNGISYAAILFTVASGFTLIFGLMRIVNLSHGALYLLGGYVGLVVAERSGNFLLAIACGAAFVALVGLVVYAGLLRRVSGGELQQVLLTLGVALVIDDLILIIWGGDTFSVPVAKMLGGSLQLGSMVYPTYRLFVIAVSLLILVCLTLLLNMTRLGSFIRAGVDDAEMVAAMGIDIRRIFIITFMLGCGLAGIGGVLGGAFLTLYPSADSEILVFSLAVVVIGGCGSLLGAALGSILIGLLATFGQVWFTELAYFVIFAPMAVFLAFRPFGLFGRAT
jgi:branched-chain amino acid transport system permease protein